MATFTLEDLAGSIEVTVFPRLFATQGHLVVDDQIVVVRGRLDRRDESRSVFMASDVSVVDVPKSGIESLFIDFARRGVALDEVNEIRSLLEEHPGDSPARRLSRSAPRMQSTSAKSSVCCVPSLAAASPFAEPQRNEQRVRFRIFAGRM
jgi:DNA polymerase-3 subunit alpha